MKHHEPLDGLRAIAVTAVVMAHALPLSLPGGWVGVDVFFVLSGFLITSILLREIASTGRLDFRAFYIRRFLRLMPAFWVMLICTSALFIFSSQFSMSQLESSLTSAIYLMNWNRAFSWFPDGGSYLAQTWSLSSEEQFYFLWPLMLIFLSKLRRNAVFVILGLAAASTFWRLFLLHHGASLGRVYNGFDTHADPIFLGCAIGFCGISERTAKLTNAIVIVPVAALALLFVCAQLSQPRWLNIGIIFGSIFTVWIIAASFHSGWLKAFLSLKPLTYTGRISYSWYVWHYPILVLGFWNFHYGRPVFLLVSYAVAVLSFHFVERPFRTLRERKRATVPDEAVSEAA